MYFESLELVVLVMSVLDVLTCGLSLSLSLSLSPSLPQAIDLSGTDITGSGLAVVADAIAVNASLTSLSLRGCKVGSNGAGVQRIAAALQTNKTLQSLDLGDTDLDIEAITQVS